VPLTISVTPCSSVVSLKILWRTMPDEKEYYYYDDDEPTAHDIGAYTTSAWIYIALSVNLPNALSLLVACKRKCFSRRSKAASVAFGLRTGSARVFQADGPEMVKAWRLYALNRCRGTCRRFCSAERICLRMWSGTL